MDKVQIHHRIYEYVYNTGKTKGLDWTELDVSTCDLLETGFLDSLGVIQLIFFLENTFNIVVLPAEMLLENFRTSEVICDFVNEKQLIKIE